MYNASNSAFRAESRKFIVESGDVATLTFISRSNKKPMKCVCLREREERRAYKNGMGLCRRKRGKKFLFSFSCRTDDKERREQKVFTPSFLFSSPRKPYDAESDGNTSIHPSVETIFPLTCFIRPSLTLDSAFLTTFPEERIKTFLGNEKFRKEPRCLQGKE